MRQIDYVHLPDSALLRSADFLRPGPVPYGRTRWAELVAAGEAPAPVASRSRGTFWRWADIRTWLDTYAAGAGA